MGWHFAPNGAAHPGAIHETSGNDTSSGHERVRQRCRYRSDDNSDAEMTHRLVRLVRRRVSDPPATSAAHVMSMRVPLALIGRFVGETNGARLHHLPVSPGVPTSLRVGQMLDQEWDHGLCRPEREAVVVGPRDHHQPGARKTGPLPLLLGRAPRVAVSPDNEQHLEADTVEPGREIERPL